VVKRRRHTEARASDDKVASIKQGPRHLDCFFNETPSLSDEILKAKNRVYAMEHLKMARRAWRNHLPQDFLRHWKAGCSYRKRFRFHPEYLIQAAISSVRGPSKRWAGVKKNL
jgi:hypothetical protein